MGCFIPTIHRRRCGWQLAGDIWKGYLIGENKYVCDFLLSYEKHFILEKVWHLHIKKVTSWGICISAPYIYLQDPSVIIIRVLVLFEGNIVSPSKSEMFQVVRFSDIQLSLSEKSRISLNNACYINFIGGGESERERDFESNILFIVCKYGYETSWCNENLNEIEKYQKLRSKV